MQGRVGVVRQQRHDAGAHELVSTMTLGRQRARAHAPTHGDASTPRYAARAYNGVVLTQREVLAEVGEALVAHPVAQ